MLDQLLAPLAWPREAVSNLGMTAGKLIQGNATNEDLLAAAPGAAGALAAALAGVPAGLLTGGLLQGGAKMVAPEIYGDKSSALLEAIGGDPESGMQHAVGMMAIDPLMWSAFGQAGKAAKLRNVFNERMGLGGPSIAPPVGMPPQSAAEIQAALEADATMQAAKESAAAQAARQAAMQQQALASDAAYYESLGYPGAQTNLDVLKMKMGDVQAAKQAARARPAAPPGFGNPPAVPDDEFLIDFGFDDLAVPDGPPEGMDLLMAMEGGPQALAAEGFNMNLSQPSVDDALMAIRTGGDPAFSKGLSQYDAMHNQALDMMQDLKAGDPHARSLQGLRERVGLGKEASRNYNFGVVDSPEDFPPGIYDSVDPMVNEAAAARMLDDLNNRPATNYFRPKYGSPLTEAIDPAGEFAVDRNDLLLGDLRRRPGADTLASRVTDLVEGPGSMEEYVANLQELKQRGFPINDSYFAKRYLPDMQSTTEALLDTVSDSMHAPQMPGVVNVEVEQAMQKLNQMYGEGFTRMLLDEMSKHNFSSSGDYSNYLRSMLPFNEQVNQNNILKALSSGGM